MISVSQNAIKKPVLMVLTSHDKKGATTGEPTGFFLGELTHTLAELEKAGIAVELVSIKGGQPPIDGFDLSDPVNAHYWRDDLFQSALAKTKSVDDINDASDYAGIFFAGGHGVMWDFPFSKSVSRLTRDIYEAGGVVGAVCHGPAALVNVKLRNGHYLVDGKNVSAFTNDEERETGLADIVPFLLATALEQKGAHYQSVPNWHEKVVVDGQLVTGQNPQSAAGVGRAMAERLLATQKL